MADIKLLVDNTDEMLVVASCFIYLPYLVYTTCIFNQFSMHASIKRTFYILALLFISVVQEVENFN